MTGVLIKRGDLEADMTPGRMPCEHEGRDPCDSSTSQEMPKTASKPPEARRQAQNLASLTSPRREPLLQTP